MTLFDKYKLVQVITFIISSFVLLMMMVMMHGVDVDDDDDDDDDDDYDDAWILTMVYEATMKL